MYFPYIRGRQYELLAIKELASKNLICDKVVPIIEPVKLSSTLINAISEYIKCKRYICIILNPKVGNFFIECKNAQPKSKEREWCDGFNSHCDSNFVIPSLIMNMDVKLFINDRNKDNLLIIHNDRDFLDDYEKLFTGYTPQYTLIPDERVFRRSVTTKRVIFADKFVKKMRNSDYAKKVDEPFSDELLFFETEGYAGFSDYSMIGNDYLESGFAPYAVAIHIVYFDNKHEIRIRHFVSDSNDDIEDPAGKFYEALQKLYTWYHAESNPPRTEGINAFLEHYRQQTYPGLGTVKKLSLMHHLELVSNYFEGKA